MSAIFKYPQWYFLQFCWRLNYPSTNQSVCHICTYWAKAEETGKASSQQPLPSEPLSAHFPSDDWPAFHGKDRPCHRSVCSEQREERTVIFRTRLLILPDRCGLYTLLEDRSPYVHDELWIRAAPRGHLQVEHRVSAACFPNSEEDCGLRLCQHQAQTRRLHGVMLSRLPPLGSGPLLWSWRRL